MPLSLFPQSFSDPAICGADMTTYRIAAVCAVAFLCNVDTSLAVSFCREPKAPTFYHSKPAKPRTPYCVNEYAKTHNCSESEIYSYNRDVESYNSQLRLYGSQADMYVSELKDYVKKAVEYAKCEADALD
jgi:hypothetical protein